VSGILLFGELPAEKKKKVTSRDSQIFSFVITILDTKFKSVFRETEVGEMVK